MVDDNDDEVDALEEVESNVAGDDTELVIFVAVKVDVVGLIVPSTRVAPVFSVNLAVAEVDVIVVVVVVANVVVDVVDAVKLALR